ICTTKAYARHPEFFSSASNGNSQRAHIILDEDPIGLLRPPICITRDDLLGYMRLLEDLIKHFEEHGNAGSLAEAQRSRRLAQWAWEQIGARPAESPPAAVRVPPELRPTKTALRQTKEQRQEARQELAHALHRQMRKDPAGMVRNVYRDLDYMVQH